MNDFFALGSLLATLFLAVLGMARYAPTMRGNLLKNSLRQQIMELVEARPGISRSDVRRQLRCSSGTISHHVDLLEDEGFLRKVRAGRSVRMFHGGVDQADAIPMAVLQRGRMMDFAEAVVAKPGAMQADVAQRSNVSRKVLGPYIKQLLEMGLIEETRAGGCCQYHPTPGLVKVLKELEQRGLVRAKPKASEGLVEVSVQSDSH